MLQSLLLSLYVRESPEIETKSHKTDIVNYIRKYKCLPLEGLLDMSLYIYMINDQMLDSV